MNIAKVTIWHCTLKLHLVQRERERDLNNKPRNISTLEMSFRDTKDGSPAGTGKLKNTQVVVTDCSWTVRSQDIL